MVGVAVLFIAPLVVDGSPFDKIPPPMAVKVDSPSRIAPQLDLEAERLVHDQLYAMGYLEDDPPPTGAGWIAMMPDQSPRCFELANQVAVGVPIQTLRRHLEATGELDRRARRCLDDAEDLTSFSRDLDEALRQVVGD